MRPRSLRLAVFATGLAATTLIGSAATPAQADPAYAPRGTDAAPAGVGPVFSATDRLAREVAGALADPATRDRVASAVTAGPVDLLTAGLGARADRTARSLNLAVLAAKGLPETTGSVLRLRLGHDGMAGALARSERPLVAAASTDDTTTGVVMPAHRTKHGDGEVKGFPLSVTTNTASFPVSAPPTLDLLEVGKMSKESQSLPTSTVF